MFTNLDAQISGTVYRDFISDATQNGGDVGVPGITISAVDASGNTATAVTDANGNYSVDIPGCTGNVRLKLEIDQYNNSQPGPGYHIYDSFAGAGSSPSVTFTSCGGSVNFGVNTPEDYCELTPRVVVPCYVNGDPTATDCPEIDSAGDPAVIVGFDYTQSGGGANYDFYPPQAGTGGLPDVLASGADAGATWGVAYDPDSDGIFANAVLKRHTGFGNLGIGGIYLMDDVAGMATSVTPFMDLGACTNLGAVTRNDLMCVRSEPTNDLDGYLYAGRRGMGDIDISEDGTTLYTVNLNTNQLIEIKIRNTPGGPLISPGCGDVVAYNIPAPCGAGNTHPWAVTYKRGKVWIGGVCENASNAYVWSFDPNAGGFTQELQYSLTYPFKGCGDTNDGCMWNPWCDTFCDENPGGWVLYPQPVLSDIEFDGSGNLILGFMDRTGFQTGYQNTFNGSLRTGLVAGDIRYFYWDGTDFIPESGGNLVDAAGNVITGGANTAADTNIGQEYFDDRGCCNHQENSVGGLAVNNSQGDIVMTGFDNDPNLIWAGGVTYFDLDGGERNNTYDVFFNGDNVAFAGKSTGIGDVELLCGRAPIEVGNYVWLDADGDGIQDPEETPAAGVTVEIYKDGVNVGTTTTGANGEYYFNDGNVTGGLLPNMEYKVCIPAAQLGTGPLDGTEIATANQGGDDLLDSDAIIDGEGDASITFTTGSNGQNDHSLDFGFGEGEPAGCQSFVELINPTCGDCNGEIMINAAEELKDGVNQWFFEFWEGMTPDGAPDKLNATLFPPDGFNQLCPGEYFIMVTGIAGDIEGCTQEFQVTLSEGDFFSPSIVSTIPDDCEDTPAGSITVNAGDAGNFTYTVNPGGQVLTGGNVIEIGGLTAGDYTIFVESDGGCNAEVEGTVAPATGCDEICSCTAALLATEEEVPVTFDLNNYVSDLDGLDCASATFEVSAGGTLTQNGCDITITPDPNYFGVITFTYMISDSNGVPCPGCSGQVTVSEIPCDLNATSVATPADCDGAGGSITITATGNAPPFSYELNGETNATGVFTDLAAGFYSANITDAEGCPFQLSGIAVNSPIDNLELTIVSATDASCGASGDGAATVAVSGGNGTVTIT